MRVGKSVFAVLACCLLFAVTAKDTSYAAVCNPAVQISEAPTADFLDKTSIQSAYDHASSNVGSNFTLRLSGELFTENLLLDGGAVTLDGGYDCTFTSKPSRTNLFGTMTIAGGSVNIAGDVAIVSTSQCDFDLDLDGFTSIGSCLGSADDCNDNDPNSYPGAVEICDGLDNNCDGQIDEGLLPVDADGDGYYATDSCGAVTDDCNDNDPTIYPGAPEIPYDGIDQDCNGSDLTFANGNACADCHVPDNALNGAHSYRTAATDGSCAVCHAAMTSSILAGHYGQVVRTTNNGVAAGSTISCWSCHDDPNHSGGFALGDGLGDVWGDVSPPYPSNYTCDNCHANRTSLHSTTTAHNNRIIDASCGACHTSDTTVLGDPGTGTLVSAADVDALHGVTTAITCGICHNYSGTVLDTSLVRQKIAEGVSGTQISCLGCHADKGANHGNRNHTIEQGGDLSAGSPCSSCHDDNLGGLATWDDIFVEHLNSCALCHSSTRTEVVNAIAAGANPTTCLVCHPAKTVDHGSADHEGLGHVTRTAVCVSCHDQTAVLDTVVNIHNNNCALCHAGIPTPLQTGLLRGDCATCHITAPDPDETWASLHSVNTPSHTSLVQVVSTGCGDCHSDPPPLVNTGDPKVHNGCSSCHDADGGLISSAIGEDFTTGGDCTSCHVATWETSHLVAPSHAGIVTVVGTSCASCHDNTLISTSLKTHNDCTSCHDATSGAYIGSAIGQSSPGNCATCHTDSWEVTHDNPNLPDHGILVQVAATSCAGCHDDTFISAAPNTHDGCSSCHAADGALIGSAVGQTLVAGDCTTCHGGTWLATHTLSPAPDHTALVTTFGTSCDSCHTDTLVGASSHFACTSCHDAGTGALKSSAIGKNFSPDGGNCTTCHTSAWEGIHTNNTPNHAPLVTTAGTGTTGTGCAACHDDSLLADGGLPGVDTHTGCTNCHTATGGLTGSAVGKNFSPDGGTCLTCHTGGFDSHSHVHDVSYNATTDTSQVAEQGCAACHNDSGNDLVAFSDIVTEHSNCSRCHAYTDDGNGTPPQLTVETTIATGTSVTCATCHTPKVPDVDHGVDHILDGLVTGEAACLVCHADPATTFTDPANAKIHNGCTSCHDAGTNALKGSAVNHGALDAGFGNPNTCTTCHTGRDWTDHNIDHAGSGYLNLHSECSSCHSVTLTPGQGFIGAANGDQKHDACTSCHAADGAIVVAINDCSQCHSTVTSDWTTHVEDHTGKVTPATGCASCHSSTVDYMAFVSSVDNLKHDTCYTCHNGTTKLAIAAAGDCSQCHSDVTGDFSQHTTQDHTAKVTLQTECNSCHTETVDYANFIDAANVKKHDSCTVCHNAATNAPAQPAGDCSQCHGANYFNSHSHIHDVGYNPVTDTSQSTQQGCAACHNDSGGSLVTYADIVTEHRNDCATCHNYVDDGNATPVQLTVETVIATGTNVSCATCHTAKVPDVDHGVDHIASQFVTGEAACLVCHIDPATTFTDPGNNKIHDDCTTCHNATTNALIGSAIGHEVGPNTCTSCHTGRDWTDHNIDHAGSGYLSLHSECTSCHATTMTAGAGFIGAANGDQKHDACTSCHAADGAITVTVNDCSECHSGVTSNWTSHVEDHTSLVTQAAGCASCHSATVDYLAFTSAVDNSRHDDCYVCHSAVTKLASAAAGDCSQCHSGVTGDFATHITNDHTGLVTQATGCASCHSATVDYVTFVDPLNNSKHDACSTCHNVTTNAPVATAGNCSQCHAGVTGDFNTHTTNDHTGLVTLQTECNSCHTETVDYANFIDAANVEKHDNCATCHNATTNVAIQPAGDCSQCHGTNYFDSHNHLHTVALGGSDLSNGTSCASCHNDNNGGLASWNDIYVEHLSSCATCHSSARTEVTNAISTGANPTNCLTCHSDKTGGHGNVDHTALGYVSVGGSAGGKTCQTCHAIGEPLNGTVMTTHFGDCDTCHTALIPELKPGIPGAPGSTRTCATCHTTSVHHDTVQANQGVCESCHTWPADMNNVPKQMACLGCHGGAYQHGKNADAPIQDFRICMDCHATDGDGSMQGYYSGLATPANPAVPRHGRPAPRPGYPTVSPVPLPTDNNPVAAGRGTFNMQYSVWGGENNNRNYFRRTLNSGDPEFEIGRDLNNSEQSMHSTPANGYDLRTVINENGTNTTVPYFNNIAAPNLLNSCTTCHVDRSSLVSCDNPNWTNHAGVERSVMDLAETTYLGDLCINQVPDTTAPTVNSFSLPASSLPPVPVTSFTASDDKSVTGYMITESSISPAAGDARWTASAPTSISTASTGSVTFYAWAKDAAGNVSTSLSATATVLVDSTAPTVDTFTLPASSGSPISVTSFTASDNAAVTGYLITETSTAPLSGDAGWTASAPTSISTASTGLTTFYAWAKDGAGNVSTSLSATVDVTDLLPLDQTDTFESGFGNWVNVGGDDEDWTRDSGGTPSSNTGPSSGEGGSTWYVYTETSDPVANGAEFHLESNALDGATYDLSNLRVSFYWHMYGSAMGSLHLDAWNGTSWMLDVWSRSDNFGNSWEFQDEPLPAGTIKLRFRGIKGADWSSDMALDTIRIYSGGGGGDTTAPTVTGFDLPASSESPIIVNTFTATDDTAVTGYMITESATPPAAGAAGWTATAPSTVATTSTGSTTFYAWAKDAAGNVSASATDTVDVTTAGGGNDVDPNGTYIEAENYNQLVSIGSPNLSLAADGNANGNSAIETTNGNTNNSPSGDRLEYNVNFPTGGTYYFWIRLQNSGTGDSAFVGVDGTMVGALTQTADGAYYWTNNTQTGNNSASISSGTHTINIWGREDVFIDGIYITTSLGTPPGLGGSAGQYTGTIPTNATVIDPTQ